MVELLAVPGLVLGERLPSENDAFHGAVCLLPEEGALRRAGEAGERAGAGGDASAEEAAEDSAVGLRDAGAQESVPLSPVFVDASAQFVLRFALNVPPASGLPATIEPEAVVLAAAKVEPVPESFAKRKCP